MATLKLCFRNLLFLRHSKTIFIRRLSNFSTLEVNEENHSCHEENEFSRAIPLNIDDYKAIRKSAPYQPVNPHLLKVSILGEPNAGKSTLTNSLVKWKICAVSSRVHTTRQMAAGILVEGNKQIVFLDTPGFVTPEHSKKHSLEPSFVMDPQLSVRDTDLIAVVVDISNKWTNNRINEDILDLLEMSKEKESILILNKIDAMKSKSRLLSFTKILTNGVVGGLHSSDSEKEPEENQKELISENKSQDTNQNQTQTQHISPLESPIAGKKQKRGWSHFSKVFMVSALKSDGINELREYLFSRAVPKEWMYPNSLVTDQHPHSIAIMIVREKLLEYLPKEIPYHLNLKITKWEMLSSGCPKISVKIICSNSRHKRFVIGPNGKHVAACADKARKAMREAFRKDVVLHLAVVVFE